MMNVAKTPRPWVIHLGDVSKVFGKAGGGRFLPRCGSSRSRCCARPDAGTARQDWLRQVDDLQHDRGLTEPSAGTVRVSGTNPFPEFDAFRGKMAIVFQSDRLLPWRTAIQNVQLGLEMLDVPRAEAARTPRGSG